jgi:hypothetical protein
VEIVGRPVEAINKAAEFQLVVQFEHFEFCGGKESSHPLGMTAQKRKCHLEGSERSFSN